MWLGAHESVAQSLHLAVSRGVEDGCEAIQIFVKNQRTWTQRPPTDAEIGAFRDAYAASGLKGLMAHASYLINLCSTNPQTLAKSVEALRHALVKIRTGRASTGLVDSIRVSAYGSDVPLSQVAAVSVSDSRSLVIQPWDKGMVGVVEKAILASDLGLTPNTAGTTIRLNLPALTEERRRDLTKVVHSEGEDAKVAIRNVRRDAIQQAKELLKDKSLSEDELRRGEDEIQKLTDKAIKDVDEVVKAKETELMSV